MRTSPHHLPTTRPHLITCDGVTFATVKISRARRTSVYNFGRPANDSDGRGRGVEPTERGAVCGVRLGNREVVRHCGGGHHDGDFSQSRKRSHAEEENPQGKREHATVQDVRHRRALRRRAPRRIPAFPRQGASGASVPAGV